MNLSDRMKMYEDTWRIYIPKRMPVIIRLDGKCFHSLTRGYNKPFDNRIIESMNQTALRLVNEIQNSRCAYIQSDEISLLLIDYNNFQSEQWFGGNIQKMCSVSSSIASVEFSGFLGRPAYFDSRVFALSEREVCNYFIHRQQDAVRNSISSVAQSLYSDKELFKKNSDQMQELIYKRGINWNDYPSDLKRGRMATKSGILDVPIFSKHRDFIESYMCIDED